MHRFNTTEERIKSFKKAKSVTSLVGENFKWSESQTTVLAECFQTLYNYGKTPANGWYTRLATFAMYSVPEDSWEDRIIYLMRGAGIKTRAVTVENLCMTYGEVEGKNRWELYKEKQAYSNSFEYKKDKYGWSEEEYKDYNNSRACTMENMVRRHGEEIGLQKWKEYCNRQRETCSLEYFIAKWGKDKGQQKYYDWMKSWVSNGKSEEVILKILQVAFLNKKITQQYRLAASGSLDRRTGYFYDFACIEDKRLIEFNGTVWHADPRYYSAETVLLNKITAAEKWEADRIKIQYAVNQGYKVFVIWEDDWVKDSRKLLTDIKEWWNNDTTN